MNWKAILVVVGLFGILEVDAQEDTVTITFIINDLPANTPHDASIYLATDVDGWFPDVTERRFEKKSDGTLRLMLNQPSDTINFKITRGSWHSVEARNDGRALPNRIVISNGQPQTVHLTIETWEDISLGFYTVYMIFLVLAALQGLLLMIVVNTIRNKNKPANTVLSSLLLLITISLLGRAAILDPRIFNWQPKLIFLPELILFSYGPAFYLYVHKLLRIKTKKSFIVHFIPSIIQLALYLPFLIASEQKIIYDLIDKKLFPYFAVSGAIALFFNMGYWFLSRQLVNSYVLAEHSSEKQGRYLKFIRTILKFKLAYLTLWFFAVIIYLIGKFSVLDTLEYVEVIIDTLWLAFSFIIFTLAFYALKYPELLQVKKKYQDSKFDQDEATLVQSKLIEALTVNRIYLKPDLTLESVAHSIPTASHTLSRVINEKFQQNFTELINSYRIKAFIEHIEKHPKASYLEVAFSVGFNSKPTFNRVFKKLKGCTPRQYFKQS